ARPQDAGLRQAGGIPARHFAQPVGRVRTALDPMATAGHGQVAVGVDEGGHDGRAAAIEHLVITGIQFARRHAGDLAFLDQQADADLQRGRVAVGETRIADQEACRHAITVAGCSLSRMTGPSTIHDAANVDRMPPRTIVCTSPMDVPRIPPMNAPSGMVPQTMVRMVAFIRPWTRSGVMACRKLTWLML